ncbi:hypothetical protein GLYMA_18G264300v4 [Glycine max]|uniref:Uncharacterized protein n=1 Tax=Glycine max TaxID=3847 RepID=A0A0R0FD58_SOYBN|nr:hypothetical protein GYH30_051183 [Glycine max]KRH01250.1 hypothetical protein GLYMA_18G264300v4 [Glycine max]
MSKLFYVFSLSSPRPSHISIGIMLLSDYFSIINSLQCLFYLRLPYSTIRCITLVILGISSVYHSAIKSCAHHL